MKLSKTLFLAFGGDKILFLQMAHFFYFTFAVHRQTSRFKCFYILYLLGFVRSGVFCAVAISVKLSSGIQIFGVACVKATIGTKQNVDVKWHAAYGS
jgi:hypothetical protein